MKQPILGIVSQVIFLVVIVIAARTVAIGPLDEEGR
jgi:hypothetical protein